MLYISHGIVRCIWACHKQTVLAVQLHKTYPATAMRNPEEAMSFLSCFGIPPFPPLRLMPLGLDTYYWRIDYAQLAL